MWAFCRAACLSTSSTPVTPPSKTSINLWGLGGVDNFQQRLTVLSLLRVPLITVSPTKAPGAVQWPPCHGAPACGVLSGQSSWSPFSTMLISIPELLCLHLRCYSRLVSQGSPGCVAPFPLSHHQNRAFHWVSQGRTAHLAAAVKLAPGRAPGPVSWSMVQLIHYFLVC